MTETAVAFVNLLVPGRFGDANTLLDPTCEYHYAGAVHRGGEIIRCFEQSHAKAAAELDRIEYLPGVVDSVDGTVVTVRVFDRIHLEGKSHTYSDRLAISLVRSGDDWKVRGIEHQPIEAERRQLNEFLGR